MAGQRSYPKHTEWLRRCSLPLRWSADDVQREGAGHREQDGSTAVCNRRGKDCEIRRVSNFAKPNSLLKYRLYTESVFSIPH